MSIKYNGQTIAGNYTSQIIGLSNTEKAGIIKIATDEEISTGTSNQVATTPLHLSKKQDKLIAGENVTLTPNKNGTTIDVNVPPNVLVDDTTIVKDETDIISAIAVRTKNNEILYDWIGTSEEYESGISDGSISLDWLCYITDDEFVFDSNEIVDNARDTVLNDIGIRTYSIDNVYRKNELVITVNENNELKLYRSLVNDNTGHELTDTNYWVEENIGSGGGLEIGDIGIAVLAIDETQGLRRYLNGQQIPINDNTQAFLEKLEATALLYPSILTSTQQEWDDIKSSSAFGQCGKFYIDPDKTYIQLPCITGFIQGLSDLSSLGDMVEAGLPNIEGFTQSEVNVLKNGTGAFTNLNQYTYTVQVQSGSVFSLYKDVNFDASKSNPIYGSSTTVQPESIRYPYFIQIATGQKTEVNITNTLELNNPYSLLDIKWSDKIIKNLSWLLSNGQFNTKALYPSVYNLILTEYNSAVDQTEEVGGVNITFRKSSELNMKITTDKTAFDNILQATNSAWYYVLDTTNEGFYLPILNGFLQFGSQAGTYMSAGLPNITGTFSSVSDAAKQTGATYITAETIFNGGASGYQVDRHYSFDASRSSSIYGNSTTVQPEAIQGYLYFYVGETVQNANLINAAELQTMISKSKLLIGDPIYTLSNTLSADEIWLEGAEISRTTYAALFEIYGTTYGEGDGSTTFNLPDFRNRTIWGAEDFGYIEAGLPNITGSAKAGTFYTPYSGALYPSPKDGAYLNPTTGQTGMYDAAINIDASLSSSIYGNSTTVQPPSVKVRVKTKYM